MITSNKVVIKAKSFLKSIQKDGRKDESVDEAGITKKSSVLVKISNGQANSLLDSGVAKDHQRKRERFTRHRTHTVSNTERNRHTDRTSYTSSNRQHLVLRL